MFDAAGELGPVLLGLGGFGALLALVFAAIGILGKRVPLLAWIFMPAVITAIGAFLSYSAVGAAETALSSATSDIGTLASSGLADAYGPRWLAHWVVAGVSAFSVWCAAISALIKPGGETRSTPFVAILAFLIAALSPVGTAYLAISAGLGTQAFALIGLVSFAGVGCALVAFRRALHEAAYRVASLRFAAGILMLFTTAHAIKAVVLSGHMARLTARATTATADMNEVLTAALTTQADIVTLGWIMLAVGLAIALFTFLGEMGEIVDKPFLFDTTAVLALLALVGLVRVAETAKEDTFTTTANMYPLGELIAEFGFQLPAAAVSGYTDTFDIEVTGDAIGDIIVYGTRPSYIAPSPPEGPPVAGQPAWEPPSPPMEWYRKYVWTGSTWTPDDTPIADIQAADGYTPLIAGPGATPSTEIVELLELFGGTAHILMRVSEMDMQIVPELAYIEANWMTLRLGNDIDFETELYAHTERYDPYVGVARYIGTQRRNDKAVHRIAAAIEHTGATAMRATVGERTRLDHISSLCLNTQVLPGMEPGLDDIEEAPTRREDFDCTIAKVSLDDAIAAAVEAVGMPTAENATITVEVEEGIDPIAADVVKRELEAFGACAGQVQDDMGMEDAITGRLATSFTVDDRGRAGRFEFEEERRDITVYDMKLCVRERLEYARFPEYERPEPPEPELDEEGNEIEVELPPLPRVKLVLTYN